MYLSKTFFIAIILNLIPFINTAQLDTIDVSTIYSADYPQDSLTYNQYVGETISGYFIADGWRRDTINGGYNKEIYFNPYVESVRFEKEDFGINRGEFVAYYYKDGKLYTGAIEDTFEVSFTPNKVKGHLYGKPYYESVTLEVVMRAKCTNGKINGRAVLCGFTPSFGMYNNIVLSECQFDEGEMVGSCKHFDLNSVDVRYSDRKIYNQSNEKDYFDFKESMKVEEFFYEKGSAEAKRKRLKD